MANVGVHVISNAGGPDSIFEKLGGQSALEKFVDGFYDLMATDRDTKKFFENRNLKNLKKRTVDYLGGLWGGAAYRGPDLFLAHTGLGVTVRIFDVMMKCAEKQLKVMKVKGQLSKDILDDLRSMKDPLCDPTGRLAKERHAKNMALGDPFDDAANRAAHAEKQRQDEERRRKLADFRKKKQEEKQAKDAAGIKSKQVKTEVALTGEAKPVEPQAAQEKVGAQAASPAPAAEEPSETESEGSDDSALNAHLVLLQGKTKDVVEKSEAEEKAGKGKDRLQQDRIKQQKLESPWAHSGDSGLMSMETTVDPAVASAWSEGRATTARTAESDEWSSIPEDSSVDSLPDACYCELMDWRVSLSEDCDFVVLAEDVIDAPRESMQVRLLSEL
ncbi:unnamed protein product [Durusdinium trenchii]